MKDPYSNHKEDMSEESDDKDLSIDGPGSPISLRKFLKIHKPSQYFTVLVDGTGQGIAKDADGVIYLTTETCREQALYYLDNFFNGRQISAYVFRYLAYMFDMSDMPEMEFKTDKEVAEKITDPEDIRYKTVLNMLKYGRDNPELLQVLGLLQGIACPLAVAKKENVSVRFYLEHPETHLHPKKCSRLVSFLDKIVKEYGYEVTEEDQEV